MHYFGFSLRFFYIIDFIILFHSIISGFHESIIFIDLLYNKYILYLKKKLKLHWYDWIILSSVDQLLLCQLWYGIVILHIQTGRAYPSSVLEMFGHLYKDHTRGNDK